MISRPPKWTACIGSSLTKQNDMNLSQRGIDFIKQFEGWVATPYNDGAGNLTIGYGHLIKRGEHFDSLTRAQGEDLFRQDLQVYVDLVNRLVNVPLTQSQFDALVSLAYNWGDFPSSVALKRLNAGDYAGAAQRISEHPVTSNGIVLNGLIRRRRDEAALFNSDGSPDGSPIAGTENLDTESDLTGWIAGAVGLVAFIFLLRD